LPRQGKAGALLAAVLVGSFAVAVIATRHAAHSTSSPLDPRGHWADAFGVAITVAFAAYAAAVLVALRAAFAPWLAVVVSLVVQILPLASPLLLSSDAYTYWDYGRLAAVHDANPYVTPPAAFPDDPAYGSMGATWHHSTTLYGPLFTWISRLVAAVASSAESAEVAFRLIAVASIVAIVFVLWRVHAPAAAIVLVGWSPLVALHFAGGGHNDALMMAFAVGAAASTERRPLVSTLLWVAAIAVKWVAAVFLLLELLRAAPERRTRAAARLAAVTIVAIALTTFEYGTGWLNAFRSLSEQSRRTGTLGAATWLRELGVGHRGAVAILTLAMAVFVVALCALAVARRERHLSVAGTGLAFLQGWLNPWYALWGGATLAFERAVVAAATAQLVLTAIALRDAVPW
jgi:uncharacterized membrane protein